MTTTPYKPSDELAAAIQHLYSDAYTACFNDEPIGGEMRQVRIDKALSALQAEIATAVEQAAQLIRDFEDGDPCEFDSHGYCQEHMWFETKPRCPHVRAKEFLERLTNPPNPNKKESEV